MPYGIIIVVLWRERLYRKYSIFGVAFSPKRANVDYTMNTTQCPRSRQAEKWRTDMEFNYEKFKDLVHYICYIADPDKLGAVKLNKILWFSDVISYVARNEPITGAVYVKRELGPVARDIPRAIEELIQEKRLIVRDIPWYGNVKTEYITLKEPDLSGFSASEIGLIDKITHDICQRYTAKSISEKTHDIVWQLAEIGEVIPYYAIYGARLGEITEEDVNWAKQSIAENGTAYGRVG